MNVRKQAGIRHEMPELSAHGRATRPAGQGHRRKSSRGLTEETDFPMPLLAAGRLRLAGPSLSRRMSVRRDYQQQNNKKPKEKGNAVKTLNPTIQRLEERIAPGGLTLPGLSLPTIDLG